MFECPECGKLSGITADFLNSLSEEALKKVVTLPCGCPTVVEVIMEKALRSVGLR